MINLVSVPRRALRGHAPLVQLVLLVQIRTSFSAPKGVERACPMFDLMSHRERALTGFSAPKGVERACPI